MENRLKSRYNIIFYIVFPWSLLSLGLLGLYYCYDIHHLTLLALVAVFPMAGFILLVAGYLQWV